MDYFLENTIYLLTQVSAYAILNHQIEKGQAKWQINSGQRRATALRGQSPGVLFAIRPTWPTGTLALASAGRTL